MTFEDFDMHELIGKVFLFFEAQESGKLREGHRVAWRSDSHLHDGSTIGRDLSGGYYDAGDHLKLVFPLCWTVTNIAWSIIDAKDVLRQGKFQGRKNLDWALQTLRHGVAFLIACHISEAEFVAQVGEVDADHNSCIRAELDKSTPRTVYTISAERPGADLAAAAAAAFAASSVALAEEDPHLAADALARARQLLQFALERPGCYCDSIPECGRTYRSDNWHQFVFFAAAWLLRATGEAQWEKLAEQAQDDAHDKRWWPAYSWDTVYFGACALMFQLTRHERYAERMRFLCESHWAQANQVCRTSCGLTFLSKWGSCRHAAGVAGLMAFYAHTMDTSCGGEHHNYLQFAKEQVAYFCGSAGHSWIIGYGKNYPKCPHHRDSALKMHESGDWEAFNAKGANPNLLVGAMVGGPDENGRWADDRSDYVGNEVALDYNAALLFAVCQCMRPVVTGPSSG